MLAIIVAMDLNNLIGKNNDLPWNYPEDLQYFKQVTLNKKVLMGYNTFLSIANRLGKALPKRTNYVVTSQKSLPYGAIPVNNLNEFLTTFPKDEELFIIGGKQLYTSTIDLVDYLYITRINKTFEGDTYFPSFDLIDYQLIDQKISGDLSFEVYKKVQK